MPKGFISIYSEMGIKLKELLQEIDAVSGNVWETVLKFNLCMRFKLLDVHQCCLVCNETFIIIIWGANQL